MPTLAKSQHLCQPVCMPLNAIWTKRNLPGIPQEFLEIFFTASNNTEALMDELEGDKINIESSNRFVGNLDQ